MASDGSPGAPPAERTGRIALGIALLTAAATAPALFGDFIWDDWSLIVQNRLFTPPIDWWGLVSTPFWDTSAVLAREGFGAYAGLHRPFLKVAYAVQKSLFGADPLGFHAVNWLLHAANAAMVFRWVRLRLPEAPSPTTATAAAAAGALLFALHPTRAESVGWISGSTDTWMTFWALIALLAAETRSRGRLALAAVAAALAAWSKEPVWLLPVVPFLDALARPEARRRWGPTLAIGGGVLVAVAASLPVLVAAASSPDFVGLDLGSVPARGLATLGAYTARLLYPWPASIRPFPFVVEDGRVVYSVALLTVGILALAATGAVFLRAARDRMRALYPAELALVVLPLLPVLNLLPRNFDTLAGDRFLYLPSVGVAALFARGLVAAARRWPDARRALGLAVLALLLVFGATTARSFALFRDDVTMREHEVALHPDDARSRLYLANVYFSRGRPREARDVALDGLAMGHGHIAPGDELELVSVLARGHLATLSDADRAGLQAIAAYLDGVLRGERVELEVGGAHFLRPFDEVARHFREEHEEELRVDRGTLALRLGDLETAVRALEDSATEGSVGACIALAHAQARLSRYDDALRTLGTCQARHEQTGPLEQALVRVARARQLASLPAPDPRALALRDASAALLLAAPQAARDALAAELEASPADPELVQARLQADIDDGRFDLAEQVILRARDTAADPRPYEALLQRFYRERGAAPPQSPR